MPKKSTLQATPYKLRSGEWGARVIGRPAEGDTIRIRSNRGVEWDAIVDRIIWAGGDATTGNAVALVSTKGVAKKLRGSGICKSVGCHSRAVREGYCSQCHFDEFDN